VLGGIHPGKGDLRVGIDAGHNVPFRSHPVADDSIQRNKEPRPLLLLQLCNALFRLILPAFLAELLGCGGVEVEPVLFNHALDLPGRDRGMMLIFIQLLQFHLAIADMCSPETQDAKLFETRDVPVSRVLWTTRASF